MVMKAPVWHLISRVSAVGGSTSSHRFQLIDQCIRRFDEWWMFGTKSTYHWGHFLFDVANHYIAQCVNGGLMTFLLFISVLTCCFFFVSRVLCRCLDLEVPEYLVWCVGTTMMVHCFCFVGLSYFGQITPLLSLHIAMIGSLYASSTGTDFIVEAEEATEDYFEELKQDNRMLF
jgi:hypothetical protein